MRLVLFGLAGICVIVGWVILAFDYFQYVRRGKDLNIAQYGAALASIGALLAAIGAYLK